MTPPHFSFRALGTILAAAVLWTVPQPLSQAAVQELIRAALLRYFNQGSVFEITVGSSVFAGNELTIADLGVTGRPALIRGFAGEVLLWAAEVRLDATALAAGDITVLGQEQVTVVVRTTAAQVQAGLAHALPDLVNPTVRFDGGEFTVAGTLRQGERRSPAQVRGRLVVEGGRRIAVTIIRAEVAGGEVPERLFAESLRKYTPLVDLARWPLDLEVRRLVLHNDRVELLASDRRSR